MNDGSSSGLLQSMIMPEETAASQDETNDEIALNPLVVTEEDDRLAKNYDKKTIGGTTLYAPAPSVSAETIVISAQYGWKGISDEYGEVYVLSGDCRAEQGRGSASASVGVVWIARNTDLVSNGQQTNGTNVWVYLEQDAANDVVLNLNSVCAYAKSDGKSWLGRFMSLKDVDLRIAFPGENQLQPDATYEQARRMLNNALETSSRGALFSTNGTSSVVTAPVAQEAGPAIPATAENGVLGWSLSGDGDTVKMIPETSMLDDFRKSMDVEAALPNKSRLRIYPRYDQKFVTNTKQDSDGKSVVRISNGFTIVVQGIGLNDETVGDALELSADQAVIWTSVSSLGSSQDEVVSSDEFDLELYLNGNVVFRLGDNVVYADRMYYDAKNKVGIIEDAELYGHMPGDDSVAFRIGASKIVQRGMNTVEASNAWFSTSQMGRPTYRLQSNSIIAETHSTPLNDAATNAQLYDSRTNERLTDDKTYLIAENNYVAVGNLPVLYWPWMGAEISGDRSLYMRYLKLGHDGALGTQVETSWNLYQILGMSKTRPAGTTWDLNLDYLSRRGFGHGSTFTYNRDSLFGLDTPTVGLLNFYGISDSGKDNLGYGRRSLDFEHKYRYRGVWKHRQDLGRLDCGLNLFDNCCIRDGWTFTGQFSKSSDRNYVPQYFEEEWNTSSNPTTSLELKRTVNNRSFGVKTSYRTDDFYTQTNWLPRFDHYWLGQALGESPVVWYEHTKIGYAQFKTAESPYDPTDQSLFRYLDWELAPDSATNEALTASTLNQDSFVFSSRQEVDLPLQLGPVKTTPYALGEYGFWGRGVDSKNISRLYGQLGVRFNLPVWKVNSDVESRTWYVNGVAHKMNFVVDASYSDANKNYDDLILYDQIDDLQVEDFRRRYSVTTYSGKGAGYSDSIPLRFDERYYSIRQGLLAGDVTSPTTELVDDLMLVRLGWDNRWQTKRGPVDSRRVVDWITFNAGINLYPKSHENFGKVPGLLDYDATWQVGDRFAILSSGLYDFWGSGQKITRFGVQRRRPGLSSCYLGIDRLDGPIDSTYLNFGLTYRTSERWALGFSNSFDLSSGYNIGQKATVSRIGESLIFSLGASRNESKNNWGVSLSVEPIFLYDKNKREEGLLGLGNM